MTPLSPVLRAGTLALAGAALLLSAGCSRETPTGVLALVGDKAITIDEFTRQLEARRGRSPVPVDAEELLNELVEREVLAQNAVKAGLMDDPEVRERMRDVLIAQFKERQLTPLLETASVSDEEVAAAYQREKAQLTKPEQVRLAILHAQAEPGEKNDADNATRLRLEAAAQLARQQDTRTDKGAPASFGPLAAQHSDDQESRYRGGDIGWVERERFPGRLDPAVIEAGFALQQPGQISEVIAGAKGYYVVKLLERLPAAVLPLEQAAPALRSRLLADKQGGLTAGFHDQLRQGLRVEVHTDRLAQIAAAKSGQVSSHPSLP